MRLLIAGCGDVGSALGLRAAAAGHEVLGLRRDPSGLPDPIVPVAADLTDPTSLAAVPEGVEAVVVTVSPDGPGEAAYRSAYLDAPARLLRLLRTRGDPVRRLLFTSSTAVHGQDDGSRVDERSETHPIRHSGRVLLEAERAVLRADVAGPRTVLRLGGVYGPGRTALVDRVRAGEEVCVAGRPAFTNRIHRDDAAAALAHLLDLEAPAEVYLGVDDDPADRCAVVRWLAARIGAPPPRTVPAAEAPPRRAGSKRCSNRRLRATGWAPRYPSFRDGYAALLGG